MKVWAAVAVALLAAGWFGFSHAYRAGYKAGSAVTEAEWSAVMAKVRQESTAVIVAQYEKHRADVLRRERVERDLQSKLGAADRRGRDLARRLRNAASGLPGACPAAPVPDAPAGESGDAGEVGEAIAAHLAACERDATRLAELQDWLR